MSHRALNARQDHTQLPTPGQLVRLIEESGYTIDNMRLDYRRTDEIIGVIEFHKQKTPGYLKLMTRAISVTREDLQKKCKELVGDAMEVF